MLRKFLKYLNPIQPLFDAVDMWGKAEERKLAARILERRQPGRRHTDSEWRSLEDEVLADLKRQR